MIYLKFFIGYSLVIFFVTISEAWEPVEYVEFKNWATNVFLDPSKIKNDSLPEFVLLTMSVTNECYSKEECIFLLNSEAMSKVIPHFYVGGDGHIYVGHGWDLMGPESLCDLNMSKPMIEINFIGDFENSTIPIKQLNAAQKLLEHGILNRKLSESYNLIGDWQIISDIVPMYDSSNFKIFESWPHWTNDLTNCLSNPDDFDSPYDNSNSKYSVILN